MNIYVQVIVVALQCGTLEKVNIVLHYSHYIERFLTMPMMKSITERREKREERDRVWYECKLYIIYLNKLRGLNLYLYNEYVVLNTLNNNNNKLTTYNRKYNYYNRKQPKQL
jgi:hypothetical protein